MFITNNNAIYVIVNIGISKIEFRFMSANQYVIIDINKVTLIGTIFCLVIIIVSDK